MASELRRWWTLLALSGAVAMVMIDATGVSVSLPRIQQTFAINQGALQWIITIYSLTLAAGLAIGGRLGDALGRVRVFVVGVLVFVGGSVTCSVAPNLPILLVGRVIEGLGNVLMIPAAAVLVTEAFRPEERGRAMGVYAAIGGLFMASGPPIAGALIQFVGWRAVFLLNVPVAVTTLILAAVARPVDHRLPAQRLPILQAILLVAALTTLVLGIQESHARHLPIAWILGLIVVGAFLLAVFVLNQLRQREPLLDVRLFLSRGFTADAVVLYCGQFALIGQVAFNAIYMQEILHFAPLQAGLAMLLFLVPWMLMAPVAGWLYDRYGINVSACLGLSILTVGLLLATQTFPLCEFTAVAPCLTMIGIGLGLAMPQSYTDGMSQAPAELRGQAYGVLDTVRQLGAAMGMAAIGSLVAAAEARRLGPIAAKYAETTDEQATLSELLRKSVHGQVDAARTLHERWPAAFDALKTSGARSIADGFYLGAAVAALGLLLAAVLMTRKKPTQASAPTSPLANS